MHGTGKQLAPTKARYPGDSKDFQHNFTKAFACPHHQHPYLATKVTTPHLQSHTTYNLQGVTIGRKQ